MATNPDQKPPNNKGNFNPIDIINHIKPAHAFSFLVKAVRKQIKELVNIHDGVDIANTVEDIKSNIEFRGTNVWILAFSIIIASIGLNTDSVAVIIGAMLISPLMGPILGVGLSVGINDFKLLLTSLKAFGIMICISLFVSWLYFVISPIDEHNTQIMSRTAPTPLDVIVAIAGGFAGIIASSRKVKNMNVIPGVAIATALMPPLCAAGFGLANGDLKIFGGASYLFLLNSIFISISTYIVIKYLKFPQKEQVSPKVQKRVNFYMFVFTLLILIPSGIIFVDIIKKSSFNNNALSFFEEKVKFEGCYLDAPKFIYKDNGDSSIIDIPVLSGQVKPEAIEELKKLLPVYGLEGVKLNIHQQDLEAILAKRSNLETEKDQKIHHANQQLIVEKTKRDSVEKIYRQKLDSVASQFYKKVLTSTSAPRLLKEIQTLYPVVNNVIKGSLEIESNKKLPLYIVTYGKKNYMSSYTKRKYESELQNWIKVRCELDTVLVRIEKQ